ncbi:MAG: polysaccharide deacetylase family protein [Desulfocucumaceae bacterium]
MKISRLVATTSILLTFAVIMITGGCAGLENKQNNTGQAPVATAGQPLEKPAEPPANQAVITQPEAENKTIPIPKPSIGVPSAEANSPENKEKVVYLTFDDGPNSHFTGRVLDILSEKKVKATFMVVGKNVELNPGVINRIIAEGHGVANHTYSHDYGIIYKSPEAFIADLEKNNSILKEYTRNPVYVFRAPGGPQKLGPNFKEKLKENGYYSVGWNITSVDSDPNGVTVDQEYNNIVSDLERVERMKKTPIILMHDGTQLSTTSAKPGTALAKYIQNRESTIGVLPRVIELLLSKGYKFALVDEHTPPAW